MKTLTVSILTLLLMTGCSEINTTDPVDSYKYWAGTTPPKDLEIVQAKYWQSSHWSKEYILYLRVKPTNEWWNEFVKQNNLTQDNGQWSVPTNSPGWFKLPATGTLYRPENDFYDSRFFRDSQTGECYIYDIQL
jgi:uncharacterized protein YceK